MKEYRIIGHLLALITIVIWASTFIVTKVLLNVFSPEEILWYRFILAFIILVCIAPKNIGITVLKDELIFFLLGLTGITLYYWTENLALKYSSASNVGLIVSAIPLFTALMMQIIRKEKKIPVRLLAGGTTALLGIGIVIYQGHEVSLNPLGDLLALCAAIVFAMYSIIIQKVNARYEPLKIITKTFFYGILTIFPVFLFSSKPRNIIVMITPYYIANILFLVIFASLLCFMMWNKSIKILGSEKATRYIYFVPFMTMIISTVFLKEVIDRTKIVGAILIFIGVYIHDRGVFKESVRDQVMVKKLKTKSMP